MLRPQEDVTDLHALPRRRPERDQGEAAQHEGPEVWLLLILPLSDNKMDDINDEKPPTKRIRVLAIVL